MKHFSIIGAFIFLLILGVKAQEPDKTYNIAGYDMFGKVVNIGARGRMVRTITIRLEKNNFFKYYEAYKDGKYRKFELNNSIDFDLTIWYGKVENPTILNPSNFWDLIKNGTMLGVKFKPGYWNTEADGYTLVEQGDGYISSPSQVDIFEDQTTSKGQIYHFKTKYTDGLAAIEYKGKWGFIDNTEKLVIPMMYDGVGYCIEVACDGRPKNGLWEVELNDKWGCINRFGKTIIPFKYTSIYANAWQSIVVADLNDKKSVLDKNGKVLLPLTKVDNFIISQEKRMIYFRIGSKASLYDWNGKFIRLASQKEISQFWEAESAD